LAKALLILAVSATLIESIPQCLEDCNGADGQKVCPSACYGEEADTLCLCDQASAQLNFFQSTWNYLRGVPTPREWICTGAGCNDLSTNPPTLATKEDCSAACIAESECNAYVWQEKFSIGEPLYTCSLMSECKSLDDVGGIEECHTCDSGRRCRTCPMGTFTPGPTSIHWKCSSRSGDIYHTELAEGTICSPTHSCPDPEVNMAEDRLTCDDTGKWMTSESTEQEVENIDTQCTCEQFTIANSPGTTVFCNLPVVPEENGDIILTQANTCVMTCDGHFVTEISCGFNDSTGGTSWFSNMGDGGEPDVVSGCLTCLHGYCPEGTTSGPTTAAATTPAPTTAAETTPAVPQ